MKEIQIFDTLGRKIDNYKNINSNTLDLINLQKSNSVIIIKSILENDVIISKKYIF